VTSGFDTEFVNLELVAKSVRDPSVIVPVSEDSEDSDMVLFLLGNRNFWT
jgi:hypothetical protein